MNRRIPVLRVLGLLLVGALVTAGCGSSSSTSGATTTKAGGHPAGAEPSASASSKMVCQSEAQTDIAASIGVKATVSKPTWVDDVYACKYVYPNGTITLSVKELLNEKQTTAEYKAFATKLGKRPEVVSFGEGAFITTNGSVIVRKDFKVLDVDVSALPQQFGDPPQDRSNVALSIAATVMSCWTGE